MWSVVRTVLVVVSFSATVTNAVNLLILGDSIDRFITLDFCETFHSQYFTQSDGWGDGGIRYRNARNGWIIPALRCTTSLGDSISFVHTFGSPATGPYHMGLRNHPEDPYADTNVRVPRVFELYQKQFNCLPDRVLFHTTMWDLPDDYRYGDYAIRDSGNVTEQTLQWFERNTIERIEQIQSILKSYNHHADIFLRTAAYEATGGNILRKMNDVVRSLAQRLDLSLFDLDNEAWSTVHFNYAKQDLVIRDNIHPFPHITGPAGAKLIGRRYSSNMHYRGTLSANSLVRNDDRVKTCQTTVLSGQMYWSHGTRTSTSFAISDNVVNNEQLALELLHNCDNYDIKLIAAPKAGKSISITSAYELFSSNQSIPIEYFDQFDLYFSLARQNARVLNDKLTVEAVFNQFKLSYGDFFFVLPETIQTLEITGPVPMRIVFGDTKAVLIATDGTIYYRGPNEHKVRQATNLTEVQQFFGVTATQVVRDVDIGWIYEVKGEPLPNIYHENALFRFYTFKQVYALRGGKRRAIPDASVFFKYGYDFSDVVAVKNVNDMNIIPEGDTLT